MQQAFTGDSSKATPDGPSRRLDGWKDIAAYLGKAERTVKRWEGDRGLPVHRLPGGARASVYAYKTELDAWLLSANLPASDDSPSLVPAATAAGLPIAPPGQPQSATANLNRGGRLPFWLPVAGGVAVIAFLALLALGGPLKLRLFSNYAKVNPRPGAASIHAVSASESSLARDFYLKGRYEWNQRSPDSLNRALDFFNQAIAHDPSYANAYAGLADTYDLLREYSPASDSDVFPRALAAARKAVELDDSLAEAHRALAFAEMYGTWDFTDAEKEFRRAIELNPADPQARRWFANAFGVKGRYAEALEQMNKAQELDPTSHATLADKGFLLYNSGKAQEGIEALREVERSAPDFRSPHFYMMTISLDARNYREYLEEIEKTAQVSHDTVLQEIAASARAGYAREGGSGLLKSLYARQREYFQQGKLSATPLAKTCVVMGKKQEALNLLEEAFARHDAEILAALSQPSLLTLENEPRYHALVKKLNFPISGKTL